MSMASNWWGVLVGGVDTLAFLRAGLGTGKVSRLVRCTKTDSICSSFAIDRAWLAMRWVNSATLASRWISRVDHFERVDPAVVSSEPAGSS